MIRREKKKYYNNLNLDKITDNKKFWTTIKPLFSDKNNSTRNITLIENDIIISSPDRKVLDYIKSRNESRYEDLIKRLGLRR